MSGNKILLMTSAMKRVQLPAAGVGPESTKVFPNQASAGIELTSGGNCNSTPLNAGSLVYSVDNGPWLLSGAASDYEARISTGTPDAWSGSAQNTWLGLGTTRAWYAQTSNGIQNCGYPLGETLEIRDATSLVVLASCAVSAYAESTP